MKGEKVRDIKAKLWIDWHEVDHRDLRKPLHCALYARIWIDIQVNTLMNRVPNKYSLVNKV